MGVASLDPKGRFTWSAVALAALGCGAPAEQDERPGMWMFHCHILDHADAGMMGLVHLE